MVFSVSMSAVGLVSSFGYRALFYADAATTVLCALVIMVMVHDTTPREAIEAARIAARAAAAEAAPSERRRARAGDGLGTVLRDRTYIAFVVASLGVSLVYTQVQSGMPIAMAAHGLSAGTYGGIAAINGILIVLLQMPVTRLLRRHPEGRVLAMASLVVGAGFGVLAFGDSVVLYVLCVVVLTLGEIGYTPTAQAVSARLSPDHLRGRYQGVYQLSWTTSQIIAPLAGAAVIGAYGDAPLWIGCFALSAAAALAFLRIGAHVERRVAAALAMEQQPELAAA